MSDSNNEWGTLAESDSELADAWDACARLPDAGENVALDAFCAEKQLPIASLVRLGGRLSGDTVLAFAFDGGIKFRDLIDRDSRWNYPGSDFTKLKIVAARTGNADDVAVVESETDGARMTELYPELDVAVMPAGARRWLPSFADQLRGYARVLVATDNDEAGNAGAAKITESLAQAVRFMAPGGGDWCDTHEAVPLPEVNVIVLPVLVSAGQLLDLEPPDTVSWFEQAVLPITGLMILHGWAKSYKTFLALDLLAAIAEGQDWATYEPTEEPAKTCVIQWELPWPFYQERVRRLRASAREPELFDENFMTFSPLRRPELIAGNTAQEDAILRVLTEGEIQVVLIDPIRRGTGSIDMNSEQDVRKMLTFFQRLQDHGLTVVATHHDNKDGAKAGGGDPVSMTGSGAWAGDPDTIVSVALPYGEKRTESVKRNLYFTTRHSATPSPKGMMMQDDGVITYSTTAYGGEPAEGTNEPAI